MTEREYYRETDTTAAPVRREVYEETVVDQTSAPPADVARNIRQERIVGPAGEQVLRSEHVSVPSEATRQAATAMHIKQVVYFIFGVINVLLALRFGLLALGASEASPFVSLIYSLSNPFVLPFKNIFGEPSFGSSVFEWSSLVGIIVYSLLAYGIARLIKLMYAPARPTVVRDL